MWKKRLDRFLSLVLTGQLMLVPGCTGGRMTLDREALADPVKAQSYRVTTRDGQTRTFISLFLEGETLAGTVRITSTEITSSPDPEGRGIEERKNVTNRYEEMSIPWSDVVRVEADGVKRKSPGFLLAGGAVVVGVVTFLLLSGNEDPPPKDDGKKF